MKFIGKFILLFDEYNSGAMITEVFFDKLIAFIKELSKEERWYMKENLNEEELAFFDIACKQCMSVSYILAI